MTIKNIFQKKILIPLTVLLTSVGGFLVFMHTMAYSAYEKKQYSSAESYARKLHWLSDDYVDLSFKCFIEKGAEKYKSLAKSDTQFRFSKLGWACYSESERGLESRIKKKSYSPTVVLWVSITQTCMGADKLSVAPYAYKNLERVELHNKDFLRSVYGGLFTQSLTAGLPRSVDKNDDEESYKKLKGIFDKVKNHHISLWDDKTIDKKLYAAEGYWGLRGVLVETDLCIYYYESPNKEEQTKKYKRLFIEAYDLCKSVEPYLERKSSYLIEDSFDAKYERFKQSKL